MKKINLIASRKRVIGISIGIALLALLIIGIVIFLSADKADQQAVAPIIRDTGYATILPANKDIASLGGWERVSPPSASPVYAFSDTIGSVSITVSEQPLPDTFKNDVSGQVEQLAESYSATESADANGTKFYIGTSAKGPQSIIFAKNELLVLIKSQSKIETKEWISYINNLQ